MRKILRAARCSQMSNPDQGTGTGGDRCEETTTAMIDATYELGPRVATYWQLDAVDQAAAITKAMYSIVELWNAGSDTSAPEPLSKIVDWVAQNSGGKLSVVSHTGLDFATVKSIIDAGHVIVGGVPDYSAMKLFNGADPYQWPEGIEHAGHAFLIVGYDDDFADATKSFGQTYLLNDPLRAFSGQPYDYLASSVHLSTVAEVVGPTLPYIYNSEPAPAPVPAPPDLSAELAALQAKVNAYEAWMKTAPPL